MLRGLEEELRVGQALSVHGEPWMWPSSHPPWSHGVQDMIPQDMAPQHVEYRKLKELEKTAEVEMSLLPPPAPPSSLKQAIKLSIKVPSLYPEERSILISEDKGC